MCVCACVCVCERERDRERKRERERERERKQSNEKISKEFQSKLSWYTQAQVETILIIPSYDMNSRTQLATEIIMYMHLQTNLGW